MKRLDSHSQHFLRSPKLVKELIGHSSIKKSDTVLDIGAGSGVITSSLASRCAYVIAYETDHRMVVKLHENLAKLDNVKIVEKDFLKAELPDKSYKVFANIPFHLSSPILKKFVESVYRPQAIYLIVQKQFAKKLCIDTQGFTGMIGAQIAPIYEARIRRPLRKTDFWPNPAVDTVLLELKLRETQLIPEDHLAEYRALIADCFADPIIFARVRRSNETSKKPSQMTTREWVELFANSHS